MKPVSKTVPWVRLAWFSFIVLLGLNTNLDSQELGRFDFNNIALDEWLIIDPPGAEKSEWLLQDFCYVQTKNTQGSSNTGTVAIRNGSKAAATLDHQLQVRLKSTDDDGIGLVFWYRNPRDYYRLRLVGSGAAKGISLEEVSSGHVTVLASDPWTFNKNEWFTLRLICSRNRLALFLNDRSKALIDTAPRAGSLSIGTYGLYSWANTGSWFDYVQVSAVESQEKGLNPAAELSDAASRSGLSGRFPLFVDLHMHTDYSDGSDTPATMLLASRAKGLDLIAITDHYTSDGADAGLYVLEKIPLRLLILRSEENPFDLAAVHLLAYNLPKGIKHIASDAPSSTKNNLEAMLQWTKSQGILIVQAHPDWAQHGGTTSERIARTRRLFESQTIAGFELVNGSFDNNQNAAPKALYNALYQQGLRPLALGNSDAHSAKAVGAVRTMVFVRQATIPGVMEALEKGLTMIIASDSKSLAGNQQFVPYAEAIIKYYLLAHDQLAQREAEAARLYWGGHREMASEMERAVLALDEIIDQFFPGMRRQVL